MKWLHVLEGRTRFNCPANYIQNYDERKEIKVNSKEWVFWSSNEEVTPSSYLKQQKRILRVTSDVIKSNRGVCPPGYYLVTVLMVAG